MAMDAKVACVLWLSVTPVLVGQEEGNSVGAVYQDYWAARQQARWPEAAAAREKARRLLRGFPAAHPEFSNWSRNIADMYSGGGLTAEARSVLEESLGRTGESGGLRAARMNLLLALAESWEGDRNLVKAAECRERALAELERLAPGRPEGEGRRLGAGTYAVRGRLPQDDYQYDQLAALYRQLGRTAEAHRMAGRARERAANDGVRVSSLYEQEGDFEQAGGVLEKQVDAAGGDAAALVKALQPLGALRQREGRYVEAADCYARAAAALDQVGTGEARSQAFQARLSLGQALQLAGQTEAADAIFERAVAEGAQIPGDMQSLAWVYWTNHLGLTKRGAKGEELLTNYLASHPVLPPWEEENLMNALANAARAAGDEARAQSLREAVEEQRRERQAVQPGPVTIQPQIQAAQSAVDAGKFEDGFRLAVAALDAAPEAVDRESVGGLVPWLATRMVERSPGQAGELFERLFSLLESWSAESVQGLLNAYPGYVRFLLRQGRQEEARAAVKQYSDVILASHSAASGWMEDVQELRLEAAQSGGEQAEAVRAASDLLALEERLAGSSSEPYVRGLQTLARTLESSGEEARALPYRRQAAQIARLVYAGTDPGLGYTLVNTAIALARAGQFEEAEQLAGEAVSVSLRMRPPQPSLFEGQREQVRRMKAAAAATAGAGGVGGGPAAR